MPFIKSQDKAEPPVEGRLPDATKGELDYCFFFNAVGSQVDFLVLSEVFNREVIFLNYDCRI